METTIFLPFTTSFPQTKTGRAKYMYQLLKVSQDNKTSSKPFKECLLYDIFFLYFFENGHLMQKAYYSVIIELEMVTR